MHFFLDTADVDVIKKLAETGLVDGITTNPSLVMASGRRFDEALKEICTVIDGPVSAEVVAMDVDGMIKEGRHLAKIADNIVVKVPLTFEGLQACKTFRAEDIHVNVTLCFSAAQALLAAKAGATFISPFVGRLDDIAQDGMQLIEEIVQIYSAYDFETQILAASIRHPLHVTMAAKLGCDAATIPPKIFEQLIKHPLTDKGLDGFAKDWAKTGQTIIR
ncbi:MAG: fructose-6-phosphate aldolase [Alphaproteobacteria bacterium]|nr:fructose-6-phosphate aldolase [Alphaproteobacteria bacterium]